MGDGENVAPFSSTDSGDEVPNAGAADAGEGAMAVAGEIIRYLRIESHCAHLLDQAGTHRVIRVAVYRVRSLISQYVGKALHSAFCREAARGGRLRGGQLHHPAFHPKGADQQDERRC
jgi:hypothetical protein